MEIVKYPAKDSWENLFKRPVIDGEKLERVVKPILDDIKQNGDKALRHYTLKFDSADIEEFLVSEPEVKKAAGRISNELKEAIKIAAANIRRFHEAQKPTIITVETSPGVICRQKPIPISKVGFYIPGGTAPLFSTVLMLGIPAIIAGCENIILCSPPDKDGNMNDTILYAAQYVGIKKIFKAGGAQAIAAMAYGTESIPRVFKIFGPGNQYVMAAKQLVARDTAAIDMPAGPSEVAVLADEYSNPAYVASDLLSQAEHGADSQVILISTDSQLIENVMNELEKQIQSLPKNALASQSMNSSKAILVRDNDEMMAMINAYAPEHLIISTKDADELAERVINAGSVFIGEYTPESAGDYASGTNHTLPTHGWATAYNGVNLESFYRKVTFQKISKEGLRNIGPAIESMALAEELTAHQRAVAIRLK